MKKKNFKKKKNILSCVERSNFTWLSFLVVFLSSDFERKKTIFFEWKVIFGQQIKKSLKIKGKSIEIMIEL